MAEITAAAVRALRERTDLPMMDCKAALVEANGDEEKAVEILKKKAKNVTDKRKDNVTSEGRFRIASPEDGSAAALVEVLCESAPVAKSEDFLFLADQCAKQLLNGPGAANADELLKQAAPDRPGHTLNDVLEEVTNKIREKIVVSRLLKVQGPVGGYVHHDGKVAVLFQASGPAGKADILRDIAMHIAALKPTVALPGQLDQSKVAAEKARLTEESQKSGKPASIIEKMVEGRMKTYYVEQGVLVEQPFAKDDSKSVGKVLAEAGLTAVGFTRWLLGA